MINGKIYRIVNNIDNDIYIGATTKSLHLRYAVHLLTASYTKTKHRLLYRKMNLLGIDNFRIELLDEITCNDKKDLKTLEGKYILQNGTLNVRMAGRNNKDSCKESYIKNRSQRMKKQSEYNKNHKQEKKEYYQANRDEILKKQKLNYLKKKEAINNNKMLINNI